MKTGGESNPHWNSRDDRRNAYPPPAHVTAHGQSRFSSPGPWPRQRPSHYSSSPGGYDPYHREAQQRHGGGREHGGHSQRGGHSQYGGHSQQGRYSQHGDRGDSYGRGGGYGRQGGNYGGGSQNDPRRNSTGVRPLFSYSKLGKTIDIKRK